MLSNAWAKVAGFLALVAGLLGAALLYTGGQRDRAREAASRAKAEAQSRAAVQEAERAIDDARALARKESDEIQHEADQRPTPQRPTGPLRR